MAERPYLMGDVEVAAGRTVGFIQRVIGSAPGQPWYQAEFMGHANPGQAGFEVMDSFDIRGYPDLHLAIQPGCDPHLTAAAMIANSSRRVVESKPGLATIADLRPAFASPTITDKEIDSSGAT